ncbi:B-4DMT family transporter [Nocardia yamanashiensis]|uniref:B-4DMT family transporter n=1 Tax=Nocardia yamanashiensis TaxID=209247 RepID=UPI000AE77B92|nr:B-4DMT family transporter [Nocardia yamanashiensis]UGT43044.1 B-4DMT family transporter [Nocardia yamanashiensis]
MNAWVLRAVALGALTIVLRTVLGFAMVYWPTSGSWMRMLGLIVLVGAVLAWGVLDGRADRRANPDPERGADLTMRWLKAAVAGGLGAGLVAWLLDFVPKFDLGDQGLLFELTSSASFIILLIFVPAMIGVALGRFLVGRESKNAPGKPDAEVSLNKEPAGV